MDPQQRWALEAAYHALENGRWHRRIQLVPGWFLST